MQKTGFTRFAGNPNFNVFAFKKSEYFSFLVTAYGFRGNISYNGGSVWLSFRSPGVKLDGLSTVYKDCVKCRMICQTIKSITHLFNVVE